MELKKPTDLYYIQDSREYVGNCVIFWGKNNSSYVCDITKAGLYTYEEAMSQHKSRHTDIPWLKEDVENALRTFCDSQYLSKRQHEVYDELEQHKLNKAKQDKDDRERAHIAQLSIENLAYENKRMGDFLEILGLDPDEITSYVINGDNYNDIQKAVKIIKETI